MRFTVSRGCTGRRNGIFNGYCGAESGNVPVSTVAPPVLLQEIELQRTVEGKDRPPILLSPMAATTTSDEVKEGHVEIGIHSHAPYLPSSYGGRGRMGFG